MEIARPATSAKIFDDKMYKIAVKVARTAGKTSVSHIQRSLRIGYNRAARLIERMELEGVVGEHGPEGRKVTPSEGAAE